MKRFQSIIGFLLIAGTLFAQTPSRTQGRNQFGGINLSLWKNVATQQPDTLNSTWLNIGLASVMNRLNGLSINVLASVVRTNTSGVQLAGLACVNGGQTRGIQLSGITNVNGEDLRGISLAGLVNITGNGGHGLVAGGLTTITGDNIRGITLGGLLNIAGNKLSGCQIGGLANVAGGNCSGISLAGLLNVSGESLNGLQIAGLGNITGESMGGLQVSALGNVTGGTIKGVQLSPLNIALRVKGIQLGLVNYYKDTLQGAQIGLVNLNPRTRYQLILSAGNTSYFDTGVRFMNHRFYTILGLGTGYRQVGGRFSNSFFYRAGAEYPIYKDLSLGGDLGFRHIETWSNRHHGYPKRLYALQARLNLSYRLTSKVALFATGGYGGSRLYNRSFTYDKAGICEAGLILF